MNLILLALLQLTLSVLIGVLVLFTTYRILQRIFARQYTIEPNNRAFAIFSGAILLSVGYIISAVIQPLLSTFRLLHQQSEKTMFLLGEFALYLVFFILISAAIALLVNLIGTGLFTLFTKDVKEMEEISKDNISVAITVAVIIVVISLFVRDGVVFLLETLVPYPDVPQM